MANLLETLQNFYIHNILPEGLTRKIENSAPKIFDGQKDKLYCFCNSPYSSDETWIGCNSEKCKWEWFHLSFVMCTFLTCFVTLIPHGLICM